jgi:hypothetical protein
LELGGEGKKQEASHQGKIELLHHLSGACIYLFAALVWFDTLI